MNKPEKLTTVVSTKGQVILPAAIRKQRHWDPGTRLIVEQTSEGVLLRSEPLFPPTNIDEVAGMLKYDGPPISIEDMSKGVEEYFRGKHARD
jgi:AbrB family looped-hinge helix DNA binding protein